MSTPAEMLAIPSLDGVSVIVPSTFPMTPDQAFSDMAAKDPYTASQFTGAAWQQDGDSIVKEASDPVYGDVRMVISNVGYSIVRGAN